MSATNITSSGKTNQLDGKAQPDEQVTERDVQDPPKLARLLTRFFTLVNELTRRWNPKRIDFEDVHCGSASALVPSLVRLTHHFGGRVRWYVVDCTSGTLAFFDAQTSYGMTGPQLLKSSLTDENTLVLESYFDCTCTIRVEESG